MCSNACPHSHKHQIFFIFFKVFLTSLSIFSYSISRSTWNSSSVSRLFKSFPICGNSAFQNIRLLSIMKWQIFFSVLLPQDFVVVAFEPPALLRTDSLTLKSRQYCPNFSKYFSCLTGDFHTQKFPFY